MRNTDKDWQNWGKNDPYFGVLTDSEYRAGNIADHIGDFFAKGDKYVSAVLDTVRRHFPSMQTEMAFDFGCGVGRLTLPIARVFNNVVGADISQSMLDEAQSNAKKFDLSNIKFKITDDAFERGDQKFDFVNTYIVLQHIPVNHGLIYIDQMLSLLRVGGVASIHFTVDRQQGPLRLALYEAQKRLPVMQKAANLIRRRPLNDAMMQMNEYPLIKVLQMFEEHGLSEPVVSFDNQENILAVRMIGQKA